MKKKKNILEDPLEQLNDADTYKKIFSEELIITSKKDAPIHQNEHEILNFLQAEQKRLTEIDSFFSAKAQNIISHPQLETLIKKQHDKIRPLKNDVVIKLDHPVSPFHKNLASIWNKFWISGKAP